MEQSILTVDQQRWVNAIMKLTELTTRGKLQWEKHAPSPVNNYTASVLGSEPSVRYTTSYGGKQFVLKVSGSLDALMHFQQAYMGVYDQERGATFEVWQGTQKLFTVSGLTVTQVLANAIRSQVEQSEEEALTAIENMAL